MIPYKTVIWYKIMTLCFLSFSINVHYRQLFGKKLWLFDNLISFNSLLIPCNFIFFGKHKLHAWTSLHKGCDHLVNIIQRNIIVLVTPHSDKRHMYCNTLRVYREMTQHTLEVRKTAMRGNTVFYIQQSHLESVVITGS